MASARPSPRSAGQGHSTAFSLPASWRCCLRASAHGETFGPAARIIGEARLNHRLLAIVIRREQLASAGKTRRLPSFYLKLGFLLPWPKRGHAGLHKSLTIAVVRPDPDCSPNMTPNDHALSSSPLPAFAFRPAAPGRICHQVGTHRRKSV